MLQKREKLDKRKDKTLKEVRQKIGLLLQDRRNFLNILLNLSNSEQSIELQKQYIQDLKIQLESGQITERDNFGNLLTKGKLKRSIPAVEHGLRKMELQLDFTKEDLYYSLHGNEGLLDKAGDYEKLKIKVRAHFDFIREEYDKLKKN